MSVFKYKDPTSNSWQEISNIPGPAGPAGKTPVKGVDYFTEEEKQELTNEIKVNLEIPSTASEITYDATENQLENINNVQNAIDFLFNNTINAIDLDNILADKDYQTEEQVNTLIATALDNIGVAEEGSY